MLPNAVYTCKSLKIWEKQYKSVVTKENTNKDIKIIFHTIVFILASNFNNKTVVAFFLNKHTT